MVNELIVYGTPPSHQGHRRSNVRGWINLVSESARASIRPEDRHEFVKVSVSIIHFCFGGAGDLDNIAKPILDGLSGPAYTDDFRPLRVWFPYASRMTSITGECRGPPRS
jgi:hypothetical protein